MHDIATRTLQLNIYSLIMHILLDSNVVLLTFLYELSCTGD